MFLLEQALIAGLSKRWAVKDRGSKRQAQTAQQSEKRQAKNGALRECFIFEGKMKGETLQMRWAVVP